MQNTKQATKGIIQTGDEDGVSISHDIENSSYLIKMPNRYAMTFAFEKNPRYQRIGYEANPNNHDKAQDVIYSTLPVFEMDEKAQKLFMFEVNRARTTNKSILDERDIFVIAFDFDISPKKYSMQVYQQKHKEMLIMKL